MSLEEILSANPALTNSNIRVDKVTQQASVLDVIRLITGQNAKGASKIIERLVDDLSSKCRQLRINGKGKKTPVCDAYIYDHLGTTGEGSQGVSKTMCTLYRSDPRR